MPQDTILIACALKKECSRLRRLLQTEAGGSLRFRHTGMGAERSAQRLAGILKEEDPRLLIFTGTAGGLDPSLLMGQVVLPRAWRLQDGPRHEQDLALLSLDGNAGASETPREPLAGQPGNQTAEQSVKPRQSDGSGESSGDAPGASPLLQVELGLTVKRPVLHPSTRRRLHRDTGASICDMESAAVLQAAALLKVPALALKVVSDTGASGLTDFWKHFDANLNKLAQILKDLHHG